MSNDRIHRVALVGAGRISSVHLGYAKQVSNARIVGICDPLPGRAEELATQKQVDAACFTDLAAMLRETEPSIVHVVTPPTTHAALAIQAMEAGANVLVEKPMAMTVDECDRMASTARVHGRRVCIDHNRLFDPVVLRVRSLVESGALGDVVSVEAHQGVNPVELGGGTHWSVESPFAPLYNLAPHPFYLVATILGEIHGAAVMGGPDAAGSSAAGEVRVLLEGERGHGYVAFSMGSQPYLNHLNVFGTRATVRANLNTMTLVVERVRKLPKLVAKLAANLEPAAQLVGGTVENVLAVALRRMKLYPGIGQIIRRFYRSLDEGEPPPVGAAAGREVVRLLNLVERRLGESEVAGDPDRDGANGRAPEGNLWIS
jgi:predicted dehydrogenase